MVKNMIIKSYLYRLIEDIEKDRILKVILDMQQIQNAMAGYVELQDEYGKTLTLYITDNGTAEKLQRDDSIVDMSNHVLLLHFVNDMLDCIELKPYEYVKGEKILLWLQ